METLSTQDIANLLRVTRQHVTDRLTKRHDFPKPIIKVSQKTKLWAREDVLRWAGRIR